MFGRLVFKVWYFYAISLFSTSALITTVFVNVYPMNLLPAGFYDVLSPDAESEAASTQTLLSVFAENGYQRAQPPIMEFEETLLSGPGATLNRMTFRVMDPNSQRMLACRSDHTLQIGRIAATRLSTAPRPLRLSYAGPILRLAGHEQSHARQVTQVGAEGDARQKLHHALDRKNEALVQGLSKTQGLEKACALALALLRASGDASKALDALNAMDLPEKAALDRTRLQRVYDLLPKDLRAAMTVDLVEYRGFEYQTGLSFALFSKAIRTELGRGGRYRTATNEPATGFTFYAESLMPVLPRAKSRARILVPFETSAAQAAALVKDGYVVLRNLTKDNDLTSEAKRQACHAILENNKPKMV